MKVNKDYNKIFKKVLWTNISLAIWVFLLIIISIIVLSNLQFPQRTHVEFMDKQMLRDGQGAFIIYSVVAIVLFFLSYIALLITCYFVIYYYFFKLVDSNFNAIRFSKWYIKLSIIIFCLFYILLPILFVWCFFIKWDKLTFILTRYSTSNPIPKSKRINNILSKVIPIIFIIGTFLIIPIILLVSFIPNTGSVKNRNAELQQAYTLSENKPNTIVIYFDRAMGIMWNQLLMVDYLLFNNNSFIKKFPEFTSYINTLSCSMVTNASNPTINGSWYMLPEFKNYPTIDPFYNVNNNQITINQWYLDSYKNLIGMLSKHGYKNFSIMNPPYYGTKDYELNANTIELQNDLNNAINNGSIYPNNYVGEKNAQQVISLDVTEIVKSLGYQPEISKTDEINFLHNFAASQNNKSNPNPNNTPTKNFGNNNNLRINNTDEYSNLCVSSEKESTFIQLYFQTTHENYQYVKNDSLVSYPNNPGGINYENVDDGHIVVTDPTPNNFLISQWYAIQKLKRIFEYLKALPCSDPARPNIKNQYDNSNIYVISDHGTPIVNKKNLYIDVNNYLVSKGCMTQEQVNYLFNTFFDNSEMSFSFWNCIFLRKPAKYSIDQWNANNNTPEKFFNQSICYTTADLFPIIESDIMKHEYNMANPNSGNYQFDQTKSWYYNNDTNNIYMLKSNESHYQNIIDTDFKNNFILDPLNNDKINLGKRNIPLFYTNWIFSPNSDKYDFYYKYYFINNPNNVGGIFNIKNYVKSKI